MSAAETERDPPSAPPLPTPEPAPLASAPEDAGAATSGRRVALGLLAAVALAGLVSSGLLWQKLATIQEQLARQSADAGAMPSRRAPWPARRRSWRATSRRGRPCRTRA